MRQIGTIVKGIRMPIIKPNDDLVQIICEQLSCIIDQKLIQVENKDIICITESIVARAQNNYVTLDDIAMDVQHKLGKGPIGLMFPILSRNRFSPILKAIARGVDELIVQLSYPYDEVGNPLMNAFLLEEKEVNPYTDTFTLDTFKQIFGEAFTHPYTEVDYIQFYQSLHPNIKIIFSNQPKTILSYTHKIICADIHTREKTKRNLLKNGAHTVLTLTELMNKPNDKHGYNTQYGLLGSNFASENKIKLFPEFGQEIIFGVQTFFLKKYQKEVEVMIFGDGAYKDPQHHIWELADPVVSPFYSSGLLGTPCELKFKMIADLEKITDVEQMKDYIKKHKTKNEHQLGTTPRNITDLIGSLADLTSGSGDKGTPVIYIQNYFDNYSKE
jgi:hypothetical protein